MLSKLLTLALTAFILVAVGNPVAGSDGKMRATIDPTTDEQPWGGEHYTDPPDIPIDAYSDPGTSPGSFFFIKLTIRYGWFNLERIVIGLYEADAGSGKTGGAREIEQTPMETNNLNQGAGTR